MVNALVVRKVQLPKSKTSLRAAQYVRTSTDRQRYSIQNQAAVIAAYAHAHGLTIVQTYSDEGEGGLRIKNRAGLTQLTQDVFGGEANFDYVQIYDVTQAD
jgi:DNA invertase Pin-like site-specific DNA recombinase